MDGEAPGTEGSAWDFPFFVPVGDVRSPAVPLPVGAAERNDGMGGLPPAREYGFLTLFYSRSGQGEAGGVAWSYGEGGVEVRRSSVAAPSRVGVFNSVSQSE